MVTKFDIRDALEVDIYARDLAEDKQTDAFMGKGFEKALKKAEDNEEDLIVGHFVANKEWRVD